jgi:signal transduction histidine kinase
LTLVLLVLLAAAAAALLVCGIALVMLWGRVSREPEEAQFRQALHDLLIYSPDRETLAERGLGWADRLAGGCGGFVIDSDGSILATRGMTPEQATTLAAGSHLEPSAAATPGPRQVGGLLVMPLALHGGAGTMAIVMEGGGPMGEAGLRRVSEYATSITASLDRVTLNTRIHALERAKTDLLSIASHEIRGPMTIIKGYLTMLEAGSMGELPAKAHSVLPLLVSKSDEIDWMIEQMSETSRLEEGRLELDRRPADLGELIEETVAGMRLLLNGHTVQVNVPAEPIHAEVDRDRFRIVVRNLVGNAVKYSAGGTEVVVDVRREGDQAKISVTDSGVGLSAEQQARLFTRFTRIENELHLRGTGLGLWLSREIARMHGGDLTVESTEGKGSTFTFAVPLTP